MKQDFSKYIFIVSGDQYNMCDFTNWGRPKAFGCLPVQEFDGRQAHLGQLYSSTWCPHTQYMLHDGGHRRKPVFRWTGNASVPVGINQRQIPMMIKTKDIKTLTRIL
jgi:hypothetical protein